MIEAGMESGPATVMADSDSRTSNGHFTKTLRKRRTNTSLQLKLASDIKVIGVVFA